MNPSGSYPQIIPGQAPVRMDGECLLPPGGEWLHGPFQPDTCDAMRLIASRIEPIEDEIDMRAEDQQ